MAVLGLCCWMQAFSGCGKQGHSSWLCSGFSIVASLVVEHRWTQVAAAHSLRCSWACGTFPGQGWSPGPQHWQVDSLLGQQGSWATEKGPWGKALWPTLRWPAEPRKRARAQVVADRDSLLSCCPLWIKMTFHNHSHFCLSLLDLNIAHTAVPNWPVQENGRAGVLGTIHKDDVNLPLATFWQSIFLCLPGFITDLPKGTLTLLIAPSI